ncbi:MAG: ABC transporter permease [Gammaproteobacteria bacterium]|nr:ABC transporter permease [Gammaproteobacteria bacterium]
MMDSLVILWTDALIFILLAGVLTFAIYASRREHLRAPWRQVVRSRMAMITLVILGFYLVVGLLDSVHYHPPLTEKQQQAGVTQSAEIISLFDQLVTPIRIQHEKTYSAPMAFRLYAKENVELPDGTTAREFPRLKYGGAHLQDPESEWAGDIIKLTLIGLVKGLVVSFATINIIAMLLGARSSRGFGGESRMIWMGNPKIPWRAFLVTLTLLLMTIFWAMEISSHYHLMGTDKVGEDVFYQALKSIRTGLMIGTLTTLVMLPAAILLGIMAGYFRGWVDDLIQYLYTTLNSIPGVLLIAAAILMLQIYMSNHADDFTSLEQRADLRLLFLCIILGVTSWTGLCRLLRGEALKLRNMDYVQAATAFGVSHFQIILRHILPNVLHIVLITVVLDFSGLVLAEAVLSYVNIGVDPTTNSWGNMINSARLEMAREPVVWWSLAASMLFMFVLVLSANLFSDVVRDAFDPRLRGSR